MQPASTGSSGAEQALHRNEGNNAAITSLPKDSHSPSALHDESDKSNDASRASTLVSDVIQTAKTAADNALNWAEKKAGTFDLEKENFGPYSSPATCMPSDLDAIANGILPAMPTKGQLDEGTGKQENDLQDTKSGEESNGH